MNRRKICHSERSEESSGTSSQSSAGSHWILHFVQNDKRGVHQQRSEGSSWATPTLAATSHWILRSAQNDKRVKRNLKTFPGRCASLIVAVFLSVTGSLRALDTSYDRTLLTLCDALV